MNTRLSWWTACAQHISSLSSSSNCWFLSAVHFFPLNIDIREKPVKRWSSLGVSTIDTLPLCLSAILCTIVEYRVGSKLSGILVEQIKVRGLKKVFSVSASIGVFESIQVGPKPSIVFSISRDNLNQQGYTIPCSERPTISVLQSACTEFENNVSKQWHRKNPSSEEGLIYSGVP